MEKPLTSVRRESMDLAGLLEEHGAHLLRLCTRAPQESLDSLRMEGPEPPDDTLVRAIQALPPKYREVIILYYYQEWRAWEIAQRLHVPVSTVTVRLSRARGLLRERLKGWYYEQE